jgi:hypothetical protein
MTISTCSPTALGRVLKVHAAPVGTPCGRSLLERVATNQKANIAKFSAPYQLLRRVDNCLSTAGYTLFNPKPVLAGLMLLRCQYAYKAAAGMALSGQVVEAFVMMRSCLEHAGYALAIFQDPTLETLFMARHASAEGMSAQKSVSRLADAKAASREGGDPGGYCSYRPRPFPRLCDRA